MKNFINSLWKFLTSLKIFRKYYQRNLLRTFCRKFLKICGKIFGNIWNYFTNISRKFSDGMWDEYLMENIKSRGFLHPGKSFGKSLRNCVMPWKNIQKNIEEILKTLCRKIWGNFWKTIAKISRKFMKFFICSLENILLKFRQILQKFWKNLQEIPREFQKKFQGNSEETKGKILQKFYVDL